jgi:hypothetical protein
MPRLWFRFDSAHVAEPLSAIFGGVMRYWWSVLAAIVLSGGLAGLGAAQVRSEPSQAPAGGNVLGSVTRGNTTVVFESANSSDIDTRALRTWDSFAEEHPEIARSLAFKPTLMDDPGYLKRHPALSDFLQEHPEVRSAMALDPGNFAAIPPRPGE